MPRILIVAFDGLQPSQVRPELAPNLSSFAAEGVTFARNHPVFPTVTRINVASLVTGMHPGAHGLAGNTLVIRDFDPSRVIPALQPELARVAEATDGVLLAPTLADLLHAHGAEYVAVGVGTSGNAYVHNPRAAARGGATIHPEFCLPHDLGDEIAARFGPWPGKESPNAPQMARGAQVLTEYVLAERDPAVALLWFSEPDSSNHKTGVGSVLSNRALASADEQFGRILRWLEREGRLDDTDVFVLSDHGYVTIDSVVDAEAELRAAGFPGGGQRGGVLAATNGGTVLYYAHDADPATAERLAAWLMRQPWCGALVASEQVGAIPGTLPARIVGLEGRRAPDITMSFAWRSDPNEAGYPGHSPGCQGPVGAGSHGGMSRHELHNTLIARGPSFASSAVVDTPTGNVDVAPTILRILGLPGGEAMDGRVLSEALAAGFAPPNPTPDVTTHTAEAGDFRQQITVTTVAGATYLDGGNALRG